MIKTKRVLSSLLFFVLLYSFLPSLTINAFAEEGETDAISLSIDNLNMVYEQGRYAVYSGIPVDSSINIRSKSFIEAEGVESKDKCTRSVFYDHS